MNILHAVILGIVQGLAEFLPVSSSGHLVLLQKIFGIKQPGLFFDTMLHAGTLIAVFICLWKDIWGILKKPFAPITLYLIIATIPAVVAALFLEGLIEHAFDSGQFLGICFLVTSALLAAAEFVSKRRFKDGNKNKEMSRLNALFIGIMQALAIAPGISRSGATITGGIFRGLERGFAARFSFLLAIPAILGALVLQTRDLFALGAAETAGLQTEAAAVIAGTICAALVGIFAIKLMLRLVKEKPLYIFAVYTGLLGIFILFDQLVTRIVF